MKSVFFPSREVTMIQLGNLLLAALVIVLSFIDHSTGVQMAALVATTVLATTLIPARLLGFKWSPKAEADLLQIARNGKWLGIWTGVWFGLYTALALPLFYGTSFQLSWFVQRETILLTASLVIFVILLSLSNKWSYKHVKWWKQINMSIWFTVPFLYAHLYLAGSIFRGVGIFWVPLILFWVIVVAGLSGIFRLKRDYFAFWRLWILVIGSLIAALVMWFYPAIL